MNTRKKVDVTNWVSAYRLWTESRKRKLANNTELVRYKSNDIESITLDDEFAIRYHRTDVVTFTQHGVILDSGGWKTFTTKDRMNRFTSSDVSVHQHKWEWFVTTIKHKNVPFVDGMMICDDGSIITNDGLYTG